LNPQPFACKANTLPLSYSPFEVDGVGIEPTPVAFQATAST
jgi:hypothetical protein